MVTQSAFGTLAHGQMFFDDRFIAWALVTFVGYLFGLAAGVAATRKMACRAPLTLGAMSLVLVAVSGALLAPSDGSELVAVVVLEALPLTLGAIAVVVGLRNRRRTQAQADGPPEDEGTT